MSEPEANAEAKIILEHVSGLSFTEQLISHLDELPADWLARIAVILNERRQHRPLQYCLGETFFCGLKFKVVEGVLIPRDDTEILVRVSADWIVKRAPKPLQHLVCAEIGVGAGVISITLLKEFPKLHCWACDTNELAVALTRENAASHGVADRLTVIHGDWQECLPDMLDLVVSNPPYIPQKDKAWLAPEITLYEPEEALFVEADDGLTFHREFARQLPAHYDETRGFLALECGDTQSESLVSLLKNRSWHKITVHKAANNLPRVVTAELPSRS